MAANPVSVFRRSIPLLIAAFIVVAVCIPLAFMFSGKVAGRLRVAGVHLAPNLDDGMVVAEFADPPDDLLRALPPGFADPGVLLHALDLRRFAVKKVRYSPLAGMGLAPRLNLVFEFDGPLPDDGGLDGGFSQPVIHVYIRAPGRPAGPAASARAARVDLAGDGWNYQVIVDGAHARARIFDPQGKEVGTGLGQYLNPLETGESAEGAAKPARGTLTVALPMELLGDPAEGIWSYWVVTGLADLRGPSRLYPPGREGEPEIFDAIQPAASPVRNGPGGRPLLQPLMVNAGRRP